MGYTVVFSDRKKGTGQQGQCAVLGELLERREFEQRCPHTVGFYKDYDGEGADFKPQYLELRIIRNVEEFWLFLNALNI